jgi:hypothetical protein
MNKANWRMKTNAGFIRRPSMNDHGINSKLLSVFTRPTLPPRALSIGRKEISVAEVRWKKRQLVVGRAAVGAIPDGTIEPSFDGINVKNKSELTKALRKGIESAGLAGQKKWSAVIPQATCQSFILELEHAPKGRKELAQVIEWKVERFVGMAASELTITVQRLASPGPTPRFFVVVARNDVISTYESVWSGLGLQVGSLVPTNIAEAGWLLMKAGDDDAMLVSLEDETLSMVFARGGDILATRAVTCSSDAVIDEVHRTLVYYQDKLSGSPAEAPATGDTVETVTAPAASPNGHRLKLVVLINHNEENPGASALRVRSSGSGRSDPSTRKPNVEATPDLDSSVADASPFGRKVETVCRELFVSQPLPTVYSLHEQNLDQDPTVKLSRLAAVVGIASASKR